jgi:uncharacterized protein HemY
MSNVGLIWIIVIASAIIVGLGVAVGKLLALGARVTPPSTRHRDRRSP